LSRADRLDLLCLGVSALALRLVYVYQLQGSPFFDAPVVDAQAFLVQAQEIAKGDIWGGREAFWQPPLYPFFLALFCWLFADYPFMAIRVGQSLLGTASCLLVYLLARRVGGPGLARTAAGTAAIYSVFIYFDGDLLAVPVEIFLDLSLLYLILRALPDPGPWPWVGVGAVAGLAALARPNILLFTGLLLLWLPRLEGGALLPVRFRPLLRRWLLVGLPMFAVILPVTMRNYLVGRDLVLISANGGVNFYIGNNGAYDSTVAIHPGMHWERLVMEPLQAGARSPSARSAFFYAKGLAFVSQHPVEYAGLLLKKAWLFWSGPEIKRNQDTYYSREHSWLLRVLLWERGIAFPFGVIGPLSLLGLVLSWRRPGPNLGVLRLFALTYTASVVLFFVTDRYRAPVIPVLLIFAAWTLADFAQRLSAHRFRSLAVPGASLLLLVVVLNLRSASDPANDAQLYHDLGEVFLRKQEYASSTANSRRAVELEEAYPSAHHNLAVAYLSLQRYPEALVSARRALELQPLRADTKVVLARILMARGDEDEAGRQLQQALQIQAELGSAHYYYGHLLLKQGRYQEAVPHLLAGLRWQPADFWTCYEVGLAYQGSGQPDQALDYFLRAQRLDPRRPEAVTAAGAMYLLRGDWDSARASFAQALRQAPDNPEALVNMGFLELQTGQLRSAIEALERALPRARAPLPVLRGLLQAYEATGQNSKAQQVREKLAAPSAP
jgi:tetratricopeptide (TPR) repeat protein